MKIFLPLSYRKYNLGNEQIFNIARKYNTENETGLSNKPFYQKSRMKSVNLAPQKSPHHLEEEEAVG